MNRERMLGIINNLLLEMQEAGLINSNGQNKIMKVVVNNTKKENKK